MPSQFQLPTLLHSYSLISRLSYRICSSPFSFSFSGYSAPATMALLSDQGAEIVIPVCAVIGIVFSLVQWFLVSRVKLSPERGGAPSASSNGKNGYSEHLIEEEDGVAEHDVVAKCAEIQSAISEGQNSFTSDFHAI